MKLSETFAKPIDRHIDGVIKADDQASLKLEADEYVLTEEVAQRLATFLEAYTNYQGANGVWISGFFGSGKSHLLKMLALLLENRAIEGQPVLDIFLEKETVRQNAFLQGDLTRAARIPARSILFNIDQKADVISKEEFDALLSVFVKVFDEACGYYGKQGYIAQFERDLDRRGEYGAFKAAYAQIAGKPWESGREVVLLEGSNIAAAYAQATGSAPESARSILDRYRQDYRVSIEDFAKQVKAYLDEQDTSFRLNFLVDEVGQYIADNVKLMTNLQTIAESLATHCRGRAWIVVTAQEEMDSVLGEMGKQQSNDFSKIQDRFKNRLKLTSADVEEVIRKRLLFKNPVGYAAIAALYDAQRNNFKTLFSLTDGAKNYRTYQDQDHFVHTYPFIPYQFPLFQAAIENLSVHNAFEGKHSSVGERSMLGVFQEVAKAIADQDVGSLATFDLMFEGIRTVLKSQIQRAILVAEDNLGDPFAVKVLKALFLVKYVKEFKTTPRNLTVLMVDRFDVDLPNLSSRVQAALDLLEQQTYIQRSGDLYEYLTDEEKDVERDIKATPVERDEVWKELAGIVFDEALRLQKIRYQQNGLDYTVARKLDDKLHSRDSELAIHVISPLHEHAGDETVLRSQSMGLDELRVILPVDERLVQDLQMHQRTEKYIRQNLSLTQQESIRRILTDKQMQNQQRRQTLTRQVRTLLGQATLVISGRELESNSHDAQTRIEQASQTLLSTVYRNLAMLRANYAQNQVRGFLMERDSLYAEGAIEEDAAQTELLHFLTLNKNSGTRSTVKSVTDRFGAKPYGWPLAAVQCLLAKLVARGKVEMRRDSNLLEQIDDQEQAITSTHGASNVILTLPETISAKQLRQLKDFYNDFFGRPPQRANDARALGQETAQELAGVREELRELRGQASQYPFLSALDRPLALLDQVAGHIYSFYFKEFAEHETRLLDLKEDVIDPIRHFMAGEHRAIYDEARRYLTDQRSNLTYVEGGDGLALQTILDDPACFRGDKMRTARSHLHSLQQRVTAVVEGVRRENIEAINQRWLRLTETGEFADLTPAQQENLKQPFSQIKAELVQQPIIAVIRDRVRQFDEREYQGILRTMTEWATPQPDPGTGNGDEGPGEVFRETVEYIPIRALSVNYQRPWLENEADVEAYVTALKAQLLAEIQAGKRVNV